MSAISDAKERELSIEEFCELHPCQIPHPLKPYGTEMRYWYIFMHHPDFDYSIPEKPHRAFQEREFR